MPKQRVGTLACCVFGHKFMATNYEPRKFEYESGYTGVTYKECRVYT